MANDLRKRLPGVAGELHRVTGHAVLRPEPRLVGGVLSVIDPEHHAGSAWVGPDQSSRLSGVPERHRAGVREAVDGATSRRYRVTQDLPASSYDPCSGRRGITQISRRLNALTRSNRCRRRRWSRGRPAVSRRSGCSHRGCGTLLANRCRRRRLRSTGAEADSSPSAECSSSEAPL
jgi:hypothetical protein